MRVLLVEDDPDTAESIALMLRSEKLVVDTTEFGEDGLEIGKLYDYDIILLDLMLPDIDGYEVLRRLRQARVSTPILIVSGLGEMDNKIKGLGFGADDYLTKPFDRRELIARIHAIVRRSKGHADQVIRTGKLAVNLDNRLAEVEGRPLAPDRQGIWRARTAVAAQGHDPDQGDVPQPSLWRDGRAGAQDHRRLRLQAAQEAQQGDRRRKLHRDRLGPRLYAARSGIGAGRPQAGLSAAASRRSLPGPSSVGGHQAPAESLRQALAA